MAVAHGVENPVERLRGPAAFGIALDLVLTVALTAFLLIATDSSLDAVPRPFVLAALFVTPAEVATIGLVKRRGNLMVAAALPLLPAAILSWAFVTLPFAIVAFLFLAGAEPEGGRHRGSTPASVAQAATVAGGIVTAGWAVLFGLTRQTCVATAAGSHCGSGAVTTEGVAIEAALLILAFILAAFPLPERQ